MLLAPLADWIAAHGDFDHNPDVEWVALDGHRRLAAAVAAEALEVPAIMRPDMVEQSVELMLAANSNRLSLSPYEEALGYGRLIDKGMTQTQIARVQGVAQGQVSKRLRLLELPTRIARDVSARGEFGVSDALLLLEHDTEVLDELATTWVTPDGDYLTAPRRQAAEAATTVKMRRSAAEAESRAEALGVEVVSPSEAFRNTWRHILHDETEIEKAHDEGTLVVGVDYNGAVRHYTTTPPTQPDSGHNDRDRHAKKAKKRRDAFLTAAFTDGRVPWEGTHKDVIEVALKGQSWDSNVLNVAARWATAAGLIKSVDQWEKHRATPKASMATAVKLVYIAKLAEDHQFYNYSYHSLQPALRLYDVLEALGYECNEWETSALAEARKSAAAESDD